MPDDEPPPCEPDEARTRTITIVNQRGLHARAAAKFVKLAAGFDAKVTVSRNGMEVGGDSIMGLMVLAASQGCQITVAARGRQADEVLEALDTLVGRGFDEG
ncbi:MAG: HPr family phosphocarrier protein [Alphaproteobacteria bacterium]|jgi:phosphocarrier protein|nr:HPr family phosphocarrier protein [Alphaproteobacteria bacterium]